MNALLLGIGVYLLAGFTAIILLDLFTGRVRGRLKTASIDTRALIGGGARAALVVTVAALWVFWPLAIYAALFKK